MRPPPAWEQALHREVDRLARQAAWPAREAVPAGAQAVVFADEAELLACLGSDLAAGDLGARWWWPLLVGRGAEGPRGVASAWLARVEHAPAAVQRLAEWRKAQAFAVAIDPQDLPVLTAAIEARFALGRAPSPVTHAPDEALPRKVSARARRPAIEASAAASDPEAQPPWVGVAGEAETPGLTPGERAFLGVALTLVRAPSFARSAAFAAALAAWREAVAIPLASAPRATPRTGPSGSSVHSPPAFLDEPGVESTRPPEQDSSGSTFPVSEVPQLPDHPSVLASVAAIADASSGPEALAVDLSTRPSAPDGSPTAPASYTFGEESPAPSWTAPASRGQTPLSARRRARPFGARTNTGLGGLFYLVNVGVYLGLYGDEHNLPLSIWDFVALVGRGLLANSVPEDLVWPLLAALAGRPDDATPGADFALPPDFLALPGIAALESELDARAAIPEPALPTDPLTRWITRLLPYLRARLCSTLDVSDAELPAMLLAHEAAVHVTDTHLDVVLSLERLPLAIRWAGLDRDPGWVAAAGRFIAFHFE
jgi:hypothetical protein